MVQLDPNALVTLIVGAGGVTFLGALVKAYQDLRSGARTRDKDTVGSLREQRDEAERQRREAVDDRDYYHRTCARLMFQLERAGLEPVTGVDGLVPPSQRGAQADPPPASTRRRTGRHNT